MQSRYSIGAHIPASSNPLDIYRDFEKNMNVNDRHHTKIDQQRSSFKAIAVQAAIDGKISELARDEIISLADLTDSALWQPLLYIIHKKAVASRLKVVPIKNRAGIGMEYIIEDLKRTEFDVINW